MDQFRELDESEWLNFETRSPEMTFVEETVTEAVSPSKVSDALEAASGSPPGVRFWLPPSAEAKPKTSRLDRSKTLPAKAATLEEIYGPDFLTLRGAKDEDENGWFSYAVGAALEASRRDVEEQENLRVSKQAGANEEKPIPIDQPQRNLAGSWRRANPPEPDAARFPPKNKTVGSPPSPPLDWRTGMRRHKSYSTVLKKPKDTTAEQELEALRGLDLNPMGDLRVLSPPPSATRVVVVRNVRPSVEDASLRVVLERFGPLQDFQRQTGNKSMAYATYFDVRHAYGAIKHLHGRNLFNSYVDLSFGSHENSPTSTYSDVKEAERAFLRSIRNAEDQLPGVEVEVLNPGPRPVMARGMSLPRTYFADEFASKPNGGVIGAKLDSSPVSPNLQPRPNPGVYIAPIGGSGRSMSAVSGLGQSSSSSNKSKFVLDLERVHNGEEKRTALMVRNIPNKYDQKMLLQTIEENHKGRFDFFYLPIDFKNKCNVGYAFINFTNPKFIAPFYEEFHGCKWGKFNSEKICEIAFARIQGRSNLISHFQNSSLMNEDPKCRPVLFSKTGELEEFPVGPNVRMRRGPSAREMKASERASSCGPPAKLERSSTGTIPPVYRKVPGT